MNEAHSLENISLPRSFKAIIVDELSMRNSRKQHEVNSTVRFSDPTFTENDRFGLIENEQPEATHQNDQVKVV